MSFRCLSVLDFLDDRGLNDEGEGARIIMKMDGKLSDLVWVTKLCVWEWQKGSYVREGRGGVRDGGKGDGVEEERGEI